MKIFTTMVNRLRLTCDIGICAWGTTFLSHTPSFTAIGAAVSLRYHLVVVLVYLGVGAKVVRVTELVGGGCS